MFQNNINAAQSTEEIIAKLTAELAAERQAREDAEARAEVAESKADMSIRKTVMSEAHAVSEVNRKRQPKIIMLADGTQRIDF